MKGALFIRILFSFTLTFVAVFTSAAQKTASTKHFVSDTVEIPYQKISCYAVPYSGLYVVENKKQYKAFCEKNAEGARRSNFKFPKINFHKYVLMGFGIVHNEGEMLMDNHLYKIKSKKTIVFDIRIIYRSQHDIGFDKQYWILVEKPKFQKYTYRIKANI